MEQDRKVHLVLKKLDGIVGLKLSVDPDPNGCPFSRARLTLDPEQTGYSAESLNAELQKGDPAIFLRAHHASEGYVNIDAIEMTDDEITVVCDEIRHRLTRE